MIQRSAQDSLPEIIFRIPGPWRGAKELAGRLPEGFRLEGQELLMADGSRLFFEAMPTDGQFPAIFRSACRRSPTAQELGGLDRYGMVAAVAGPGGSPAAAQRMLEAGAVFIRAGGFGVFIDNSVTGHGGSDWLELAEHRRDPNALFYALMNIVKSGKQLASYGMHTLGQRDAIIAHQGRPGAVLPALEDFLRMACGTETELGEAEIFSDRQGRCFRLRGEPDRSRFDDHPTNNPYGRWRLEPVR